MKMPSRHRLLAFLLLAIQATALGLLSEHSRFALFVMGVALILLPGWLQLDLRTRTKQILALFLALGFVVNSQLTSPAEFQAIRAFLPYARSYAICQFCLTLQVILLFLDKKEGRPHAFPLFLGVVTLVYAGNKYAESAEIKLYLLLVLMFLVLAAFYLAGIRQAGSSAALPAGADRRLRAILLASMAGLVCLVTLVAGNMIKAAEPRLARFLDRLQIGHEHERAAPGFSTYSDLDNVLAWKITDQDEPALRVVCEKPPGYLRGRVFERFDGRMWGPADRWEEGRREESFREQIQGMRALEPDEYLFDIREKAPDSPETVFGSGAWWSLEVRPLERIEEALFTRLDAALLGAQLSYLFVSPSGAVDSPDAPLGGKYRLFVPERPQTPSLPDRERYLQIPERLDPRIRDIADDIFDSRETVTEKARAVESYFRTHYQYALNPTFSGDRSRGGRFNYFMLSRPSAHCEFFASGAVILLRLAGVPSRYVTGFVAVEKNAFGDYWVARNRDAHAWAEAYDDERGWITVEATPPEGVPSYVIAPGAMAQFWDAVKFSLSRTRSDIQSGGLRRFLLDFFDAVLWKTYYLRTLPGLVLALCFLAAGILFLIRNRQRQKPPPADPLVVALHLLLARADRFLARRNLRRGPVETLHQFADRIAKTAPDEEVRKAADWYRQYAVRRYGETLGEDGVDALRKGLPG